ncbi:MAG: RcnB family protein [Pseudomonadota bacterium]
MSMKTPMKSRVSSRLAARPLAVILALLLGAGVFAPGAANAAPAHSGAITAPHYLDPGHVHLAGGKHYKRKYSRPSRVRSGIVERHSRLRKRHRGHLRDVYRRHDRSGHREEYDRSKHVQRYREHRHQRQPIIVYRNHDYDRYRSHGHKTHQRLTRYAVGHRYPRHTGVFLRHPHEYGLAHPARGYGWYLLDRDVYLIALGTGLIVQALTY